MVTKALAPQHTSPAEIADLSEKEEKRLPGPVHRTWLYVGFCLLPGGEPINVVVYASRLSLTFLPGSVYMGYDRVNQRRRWPEWKPLLSAAYEGDFECKAG